MFYAWEEKLTKFHILLLFVRATFPRDAKRLSLKDSAHDHRLKLENPSLYML